MHKNQHSRTCIMKNVTFKWTICVLYACWEKKTVENLHEKPILVGEIYDKQESVYARVCVCVKWNFF